MFSIQNSLIVHVLQINTCIHFLSLSASIIFDKFFKGNFNGLELPTPLTKSVTAEIFESVNHLSLVLTHSFVPGFSGF